MKQTYKTSQEIFYYLIRVSKKDSAFLYFQLESNEGICFYSTIEESIGTTHRDIEIKGSIEYRPQIQNMLAKLQEEFLIQFIKEEVLFDS